MTSIIQIERLLKQYGKTQQPAVHDIRFNVEKRSAPAIIPGAIRFHDIHTYMRFIVQTVIMTGVYQDDEKQ